MFATPTIDKLRQALAPVEVLRGEHSLLEKWVYESFAAVDALHGELSEWQRDLTRQQAALDQREAAVADASEQCTAKAVASVQELLDQAREEIRQLEDEREEQLHTMALLEQQLTMSKTELRLATKRVSELSDALEAERSRFTEEHRQWTAELREMRKMVELAMFGRASDSTSLEGSSASDRESAQADPGDVAARAAELRRRANSLRAVQQRST